MKAADDWHFDRNRQRRLKVEMLLKVAAECFNRKGFSGTSLKDVARRLTITDAALYYYVRNKEELVYLCYLRAVELAEASLDHAERDGHTPLEKLELYVRYQIKKICGEEGPVAILSEIPALNAEHREVIMARSIELNRRITVLIRQGVAAGGVVSRDPVATSYAILGALNWIPKWHRKDASVSKEELADSYVELFCSGLSPR